MISLDDAKNVQPGPYYEHFEKVAQSNFFKTSNRQLNFIDVAGYVQKPITKNYYQPSLVESKNPKII